MTTIQTFHSNEKGPTQDHPPQQQDDEDEKPQVSEINDASNEALSEPQAIVTVWTWKSLIASIALSGLYVGSQIPIYFVGGELSFIVAEIGHADAGSWITVAYTLPLAAVAPFTGYLQDLVGRRYVTLVGGIFLMLGCLLVALAHSFRQCLVGMCFAGAGAAVGELAALAGVAELVPVKKRGLHLAWVTGFVLPFTPYVLYCELLSTHSTWRWGLWICLIWCGFWWVVTALFYWPESQTRARGAAAKQILKQIDYIGGFLSIVGTAILLVALQAGGYSHSWQSAYVLVQLLLGVALLAAFVLWEWKFCKDPMIPHDMFSGQRIVAKMYGLAFIAGKRSFSSLQLL
ncbi:major facilitator superfamily domain-containing protein [Aspergillus ambiguus]|uniref:major facilitator superfamily domain-containing protein n=1 Tax=Aspergillus ambiguus TaxID=176160 RepID=UPI003CCE4E26